MKKIIFLVVIVSFFVGCTDNTENIVDNNEALYKIQSVNKNDSTSPDSDGSADEVDNDL